MATSRIFTEKLDEECLRKVVQLVLDDQHFINIISNLGGKFVLLPYSKDLPCDTKEKISIPNRKQGSLRELRQALHSIGHNRIKDPYMIDTIITVLSEDWFAERNHGEEIEKIYKKYIKQHRCNKCQGLQTRLESSSSWQKGPSDEIEMHLVNPPKRRDNTAVDKHLSFLVSKESWIVSSSSKSIEAVIAPEPTRDTSANIMVEQMPHSPDSANSAISEIVEFSPSGFTTKNKMMFVIPLFSKHRYNFNDLTLMYRENKESDFVPVGSMETGRPSWLIFGRKCYLFLDHFCGMYLKHTGKENETFHLNALLFAKCLGQTLEFILSFGCFAESSPCSTTAVVEYYTGTDYKLAGKRPILVCTNDTFGIKIHHGKNWLLNSSKKQTFDGGILRNMCDQDILPFCVTYMLTRKQCFGSNVFHLRLTSGRNELDIHCSLDLVFPGVFEQNHQILSASKLLSPDEISFTNDAMSSISDEMSQASQDTCSTNTLSTASQLSEDTLQSRWGERFIRLFHILSRNLTLATTKKYLGMETGTGEKRDKTHFLMAFVHNHFRSGEKLDTLISPLIPKKKKLLSLIPELQWMNYISSLQERLLQVIREPNMIKFPQYLASKGVTPKKWQVHCMDLTEIMDLVFGHPECCQEFIAFCKQDHSLRKYCPEEDLSCDEFPRNWTDSCKLKVCEKMVRQQRFINTLSKIPREVYNYLGNDIVSKDMRDRIKNAENDGEALHPIRKALENCLAPNMMEEIISCLEKQNYDQHAREMQILYNKNLYAHTLCEKCIKINNRETPRQSLKIPTRAESFQQTRQSLGLSAMHFVGPESVVIDLQNSSVNPSGDILGNGSCNTSSSSLRERYTHCETCTESCMVCISSCEKSCVACIESSSEVCGACLDCSEDCVKECGNCCLDCIPNFFAVLCTLGIGVVVIGIIIAFPVVAILVGIFLFFFKR